MRGSKARTALHEIAKRDALLTAWEHVSRGKLGKAAAARGGIDGQALVRFSQKEDAKLAVIAAQLKDRQYRFSALQPVFIPKKEKGFRVICVPTVEDRIVQRALLNVVGQGQAWMNNPVSYGFVSGGGVEKAARKAVEYRTAKPWVFKTDITKFFDHVDRGLLKQQIARRVRKPSLHRLLCDAVGCEIDASEPRHVARLKRLDIVRGRGVRQGMPLSPFFANLFLSGFDAACIKTGVSVLRYADDLIFFAADEAEARQLHRFCADELGKVSLLIPALAESLGDPSKTRIYAPDMEADFLGVALAPTTAGVYEVRLGKKQFDEIRNTLYGLSCLKELRQRQLDIARFGASLATRAAAYSSVYTFCANHAQLEVCLNDWTRAVHQKIAIALGIDVSKLSEDGRWFLGLARP